MNSGTIVENYMLKVKLGNKTLGQIEEWFIEGLTEGDTFLLPRSTFTCFLGINNNNINVKVTKDKHPQIPSYAGGRLPLSSELSVQVRKLLTKKSYWENFPEQVKDWLNLQSKFSVMPSTNQLLLETFPRKINNKKRFFLVCYSFEGRNANQTLGFLLSKRMQRMGYKPLGFVATDYALAMWSMNCIEEMDLLFNEDLMLDDLLEWLEETPLLKKNFREAAIISGLIEKKLPGQVKTGKQIIFNSDLIFNVLKKHEPNHILLEAAREDAYRGLIDLNIKRFFLKELKTKLSIKN